MSSDSRLVGAAAPLRFADGTELQLSALSDVDIGDMDEWLQAQIVRVAIEGSKGQSQGIQDRVWALALKEAQTVSLMSGGGARVIGTVAGMTRLVWQMAKRRHPDITEAQIHGHILNPVNVREATRLFKELNSFPTSGKDGGKAGGKANGSADTGAKKGAKK